MPVSENIAAILVDATFQAGLNYRSVVLPRVRAVALAFPKMNSLNALEKALDTREFSSALAWSHPEKPRRLREIVTFFRKNGLNTISELTTWISVESNRLSLRKIRGIGPKTIDYLSKLLGLPVIAVDRHAHHLLRKAGVVNRVYGEAKRILEFAADLLNISRSTFDRLMWQTMSASIS